MHNIKSRIFRILEKVVSCLVKKLSLIKSDQQQYIQLGNKGTFDTIKLSTNIAIKRDNLNLKYCNSVVRNSTFW